MCERFLGLAAVLVAISLVGCGEQPRETNMIGEQNKSPFMGNTPEQNAKEAVDQHMTGFMGNTPEQNAKEVVDQLTSTPEGRATADRLASKDDQLTEFQKANDISERIAEAAIKEWVTTHGGDFDWNLNDVKAICLRIKRNSTP